MSLLDWDSKTFCISNIYETSSWLLKIAFLLDSVESNYGGIVIHLIHKNLKNLLHWSLIWTLELSIMIQILDE